MIQMTAPMIIIMGPMIQPDIGMIQMTAPMIQK